MKLKHVKKFTRTCFLVIALTLMGVQPTMPQTTLFEINDWKASISDFNIKKSETARLEFPHKNLHVVLKSTEPESLLVTLNKAFTIAGDFALDIDLKLSQVGRDDNATGHLSKFEWQFGTGAPLQLGFMMQLIRDRYKVDEQYKIYRTDENWHHWQFEIRADQKVIYLTRDGIYECAHKVSSVENQHSEFQFKIYSASEAETEIEIGQVKIQSLEPMQAQPTALAPRLKHDVLPGEWPMFRRDRQHSAHSPLKGNLKQPQIQWSYSLGGSSGSEFLDDVNGDDELELLIGIGGRLSAYRLDGSLLWGIPMENTVIYGMYDLDGDGQKELLIAGSGVIQVLDGHTGKVRYRCEHDSKYSVFGARVAKLNPDIAGQQIVVCNQHRLGYCLSFENGIEKGNVAWTYDYEKDNFVPGIAFADMDLDGNLELVAATYGNFFVYSGIDGSVKMHLEAPTGRNYGLLVVKDIDGDGYPDIVMFADRVREHICAVKNVAGDSLQLLWDKFFEQNYPIDHKELRLFDHAVDDFDGDGKVELLYGLWDETSQPNWATYLVDAVTGDIKYHLPDTYPVNAVRLSPDMPPHLLLSEIYEPESRKDIPTSEIKVVQLKQGKIETTGALQDCRLLTARTFREFPPNILKEFYKSESPIKSTQLPGGIFIEKLNAKGNIAAVEGYQLTAEGLTRTWISEAPFKGNPNTRLVAFYPDQVNNKPTCLISRDDNSFYLVSETGAVKAKFPCGGPICYPLAGDLAGDGVLRILVNAAPDTLICLKPEPGKKRPVFEWEVPISTNQYDWETNQGQKRPLILDLDLDGKKEVLVSREPNLLAVLDVKGKLKKAYELTNAPRYYTFGQFTNRDRWDLYVASGEIISLRSRCIRADNDSVIWNITCGNGNPAVYDLTGNGGDDILLRDLFEHRSLNGMTGRDIYPITQWCGYHIPTIVEPENGEPFIVWTGGAYSVTVERLNGEQLWWRPFMSGWKPAGIADVDGDGRVEIGSVTIGQLYNWPQFYPVDGPNMQFVCMDALTGETKWEFPVTSSISPVITADIDGDGNPEFIFGTTDGHLMALRGGDNKAKRVALDVRLPAAVGQPIVCDLFGTGEIQILVGCGDGKLYCIQ
ncbi:hypothetical protein JXJ21_07520 [candidate division KSB1 bacterium]|nr:hypothetical protein [candidate division KSB1 bacterium]